ncbi:putative O-antigen transporter [Clostridium puniceum]|uniref:Putative O-antigen transporter n=1 Tax=Clostridium puniceum TaxID=29367 RepID=A0A1S8TDD2_9CLOT|nr:oligosaccharide flippase family protein [Clostridium puniceum]OOM75827.1 putative O-antigen transporter [Clostridium puniceum]
MTIVKNYIYNTFYQILILIIPLITMPYLTRIFTPSDLGITSYTFSIVNYFMIFGTLGMGLYGNREIAYIRDNKKNLSETFWALLLIQLIGSFVSLILYYLFIIFCVTENKIIYLVQGLNIISFMFDISWLFMGLEDLKKISVRNSIVKLIGMISLFALVKSSKDLVLYISLTVGINILGVIIIWINVPQEIKKIEINMEIIKNNLKQLVFLFLPQIFIQVYALLDRILIGVFSTIEQVAFYDYSQKIIRIVLALITSLGIVLMSRISNMIGNGRKEHVKFVIEKEFEIVSYIAMPISIGLMAVSNNLISWILGSKYLEISKLTSVSAVIIIAVSLANIIGVQYLIGTKQENKYTFSIIVSAATNFTMNMVLLRKFGSYGAATSIVATEFIGVIIQMILVRKQLPIKKMLKKISKYLICSVIMAIIIIPIGIFLNNNMLASIIQISIGIIFYITIMFITKDEIQIEIINICKTRNIISKLSNIKQNN